MEQAGLNNEVHATSEKLHFEAGLQSMDPLFWECNPRTFYSSDGSQYSQSETKIDLFAIY